MSTDSDQQRLVHSNSIEIEPIDADFEVAHDTLEYNREAAESDLIFQIQLALARALEHRKATHGLTGTKIADALNLDKSTVSRMFAGNANLTTRSIAALCWALDAEPRFSIAYHDSDGTKLGNNVRVGHAEAVHSKGAVVMNNAIPVFL